MNRPKIQLCKNPFVPKKFDELVKGQNTHFSQELFPVENLETY